MTGGSTTGVYEIRLVEGSRSCYLPLLLLADEEPAMVERYIDRGDLWVLDDGLGVAGECLVTDEGEGVAEVKNLAVEPSCQRRGYGRALLDFAAEHYAETHEILQVGTGDSPLTIPFYERCGFTRHHVVKDFFLDNYSRPIWESGVQLCDMVYLRKELHKQESE